MLTTIAQPALPPVKNALPPAALWLCLHKVGKYVFAYKQKSRSNESGFFP
jgi:hypothetical protein